MGNIFPFIFGYGQNYHERKNTDRYTQTIYKTSNTDRSIQTNLERLEKSVQTSSTFSERLTYNNLLEVGSTEVFEETCELCNARLEKEAVGYCRTCRQFMCLQCCQIHEAISVCKNHPIVGKADFEKNEQQTSMYNKTLVQVYPSASWSSWACGNWQTIGIFNIPGSDCTLFWKLPFMDTYDCSLVKFDKQSGKYSCQRMAVLNKEKNNVCDSSELVCNKRAFFVIVTDIPYIKRDIVTDVYKFCPEHHKDSLRIAFQFCGISHSVVPFNSGLALSAYISTIFSTPAWHIRLTDFKGNIINQICYDDKGNPMFTEPRQLTSSIDGNILYVADYVHNSVTALDKLGHVLFKFTDELIARPLGITCDEENNIYVACGKTVIQIHKDGNKCRAILSTTVSNVIVDVCYNHVSRQLAVAENNPPRATIFNFLP